MCLSVFQPFVSPTNRFLAKNTGLKNMRQISEVLFVDDNMADVYLASEALRLNPDMCHFAAVGDGHEALAYLRHEGLYANAASPDVVILDLNLPKKSGESVLTELRSDDTLRKIPVVIFSSSRSNQDIVRCYELGANCYLSKPSTLSEFVSTVQMIVHFFGPADADPKGDRWIVQNPTCC
jgi:chemotaxis family two-component system response regulator Rcp1